MECFSVVDGFICLPSLDEKIRQLKEDTSHLDLAFVPSHQKNQEVTTKEVDEYMHRLRMIEMDIGAQINFYEGNGNKASFCAGYNSSDYSYFDPINHLNNKSNIIRLLKDKIESNYMQAAHNELGSSVTKHRQDINRYIDDYSDSEVESLENALESINNGIYDIERDWKNKHNWKNRARLASKVESLRVIKREVESRLQEAERVEKELERMEEQIQNQHLNRMQELEMEREIEEMRLKRQREAQQDMEDLMNKFEEILNN